MLVHLAMTLSAVDGWGLPWDNKTSSLSSNESAITGGADGARDRRQLNWGSCNAGCTGSCDGCTSSCDGHWSWGMKVGCDDSCDDSCDSCTFRWGGGFPFECRVPFRLRRRLRRLLRHWLRLRLHLQLRLQLQPCL